MITQEELKKLFHYSPETGAFTRIANRASNKVKAGDVVGTVIALGYLSVSINYRSYLLHRLAFLYMTGAIPVDFVDHINRVKNDNRWMNLRVATKKQNCYNCNVRTDNKSGHRGISYNKLTNSWRTRINKDSVSIEIGSFKELKDAVIAYEIYAQKIFGDFYTKAI